MARKSKSEHSSGLLNALSFVGMNGAEYCQIGHGMVTSITDNICLGYPIEETLECQANIKALSQSLTRSKENVTITQLDMDKLHVSSDGLQVYVNCEQEIKHVTPDQKSGLLDSRFTLALRVLYPVVSASGDCVSVKTVLLYGQSCFATNRHILVESWHGLDLPFCNIGKKFVDIILKSKKEVESFGNSTSSVTVHFKDGSWIMGRQEKGDWINPFEILNAETNPMPLSEDFKHGLRGVLDFCGSITVSCIDGRLRSHTGDNEGAMAFIGGLPEGVLYGAKEMRFLREYAVSMDVSNPAVIRFFGDKIRGAISARVG